jgi:hypothetical protein
LGATQALPQNPQLLTDDVVSVSQASAMLPSHSPRPAVHGDAWQEPLTQIEFGLPQSFVHDPQCVGSAFVFASQPFAGFPSQSA